MISGSSHRTSESFKLSDVPVNPGPNQPPVININSPIKNGNYNVNETIQFNVDVSDPENKTITDDNIVWSSSIHGEIGTGRSFSLNDLFTGRHQIKVVVTDADGMSSLSSIEIKINSIPSSSVVSGLLYYVDDFPAENVMVLLKPKAPNISYRIEYTDQNGDFIFRDVAAGDYYLLFQNDWDGLFYVTDPADAISNGTSFFVDEDVNVDRGKIIFNKDLARVIGVLKNINTGNPVVGAYLELYWEATDIWVIHGTSSTNENGLFYFPEIIEYDFGYWLEIYKEGNQIGRYPAEGYFNVILGQTLDLGDIEVAIQQDNTPPIASFTVDPTSGTTSTIFNFDASGCIDNEDPTSSLQVRWDWENDGLWNTVYSTNKTATHQFSTPGLKTIKMELKDTGGLTDTTTHQITVTTGDTPPIASFTVDPTSGTTSTIFNFDASDCTDNEDPTSALQVRWDWENDGIWDTGYTTAKTTTHQYSTDGIKTIKLEVKDTGGLTDNTTKQVSVGGGGETGTVTDIDGNVYQTVKIGGQWWMAENLKVTHYRNGEAIPNITSNSEWAGLSSGAYCAYDNNNSNIATYGLLYNWYTVVDSRNIAPAGWHVPTDEEWKQLEIYLGMSQSDADKPGLRGSDEGGKLKETGTAHWHSPNIGATNSSGFSALPGGCRDFNFTGAYEGMGELGNWWSSTASCSCTVLPSFRGPSRQRLP
jgi:uncharacterized protein (TIGR02145 family)